MLPLYCVVATCRRSALLRRLLSSIVVCRKPESFQGVIVIENGPKCGVEEMIRHDFAAQKIQYFFKESADKSKALNHVLDKFPGSLFYFLDDDVRVSETAIVAVADAAARIGGHFFLGGPLDVDYEIKPPAWRMDYLPPSARGWKLDVKELTVHNQKSFLGGNWAAFSDDLVKEGGFSEAMGPSRSSVGEETEMQRRLIHRGITGYYVPQAKVWHYVPKDRCSVKWALARVYRHGNREGLLLGRGDRWEGLVVAICRVFLYTVIIPLVLFFQGERGVFKCIYKISQNLGVLRGLCS